MAAPEGSRRAVVAAIAGNGFVAVIKLLAFVLSGSGAMLSEAIHSFADTGNQALLYLGMRLALRGRDEDFPYGRDSERFVFGLLSAAGIFFIGSSVTVYHGFESLLHPTMPALGLATFVVLAASAVIEGGVLLIAFRSLAEERGTMAWGTYLRDKADPATVGVVLEDTAAVLGLLCAAAGIVLTHVTGSPKWDAIASILIGILLGAIAVYLARQNRALLLGKAVPEEIEQRFIEVLRARRSIRDVHDVKTQQLTPEAFAFKAEVSFESAFVRDKLDAVLPRDPEACVEPKRADTLRALAEMAVMVIGTEIDDIETAVRAAIPEARHIDLEVHRPDAPRHR
jgi:solute carrier family 30 (zinc transporter), member 9